MQAQRYPRSFRRKRLCEVLKHQISPLTTPFIRIADANHLWRRFLASAEGCCRMSVEVVNGRQPFEISMHGKHLHSVRARKVCALLYTLQRHCKNSVTLPRI